MSSLRTFDPSEIQLQRFIGELGFLEITDWYVPHAEIMNHTVVYVALTCFRDLGGKGNVHVSNSPSVNARFLLKSGQQLTRVRE